MNTEYEYIHFELERDTGKTSMWACLNNKSGALLGHVAWHGSWRQYCFFSVDGAVFSRGCLQDVEDFIDQLMAERRASF